MTKHILVVEDDPELAKMWVYILERHHYSATAVLDLEAGLAAFVAQPASLVMVDYYLPNGRGTELIRRIHMLPDNPRPISFLLTSNPYFRAERYQELVDAFILKPARTEQVINLVQKYLPLATN